MSAAALLVTIGNRDCVILICSVGTLVHCAFYIGIGRVWTVSVRSTEYLHLWLGQLFFLCSSLRFQLFENYIHNPTVSNILAYII